MCIKNHPHNLHRCIPLLHIQLFFFDCLHFFLMFSSKVTVCASQFTNSASAKKVQAEVVKPGQEESFKTYLERVEPSVKG